MKWRGLWHVVSGGSRLWELRFKSPVTGKRRQIEGGFDPIIERKKEKVVSNVDTQDVLTALRPIWTEKIETAGRVIFQPPCPLRQN